MPRKKETNATEVMSSVSSVIGFIKTHVSNRLVEASNQNLFNVEENELRKINNILGALIDEAFTKSSSEIVNTLNK